MNCPLGPKRSIRLEPSATYSVLSGATAIAPTEPSYPERVPAIPTSRTNARRD
jgi:hypothetical protein